MDHFHNPQKHIKTASGHSNATTDLFVHHVSLQPNQNTKLIRKTDEENKLELSITSLLIKAACYHHFTIGHDRQVKNFAKNMHAPASWHAFILQPMIQSFMQSLPKTYEKINQNIAHRKDFIPFFLDALHLPPGYYEITPDGIFKTELGQPQEYTS